MQSSRGSTLSHNPVRPYSSRGGPVRRGGAAGCDYTRTYAIRHVGTGIAGRLGGSIPSPSIFLAGRCIPRREARLGRP
jgi:hypothetical protein